MKSSRWVGLVHPAFAGAREGNLLHCESNFCGMQTNVYGTEKSSMENLFFLLSSLHLALPQAPSIAQYPLGALELKVHVSHITRKL